jgi:hypothetical protein
MLNATRPNVVKLIVVFLNARMLSVMLAVVILSTIIPVHCHYDTILNVVRLSVIRLNVIRLSVIRLNVIRLKVAALSLQPR